MRSPARGEVWLVDLGLAAKVRPALVLSVPVDETDRALTTGIPHTNLVKLLGKLQPSQMVEIESRLLFWLGIASDRGERA